jgi:predicted amidophosphoribosyltransferase
MTCISCGEWFEIITNTGGLGLNFCPCCGHEFSENDFKAMENQDESQSVEEC